MVGLQRMVIAAMAASTSLFGCANAAETSNEPPVNGLPFPEDYFTKTVASVQNTYCSVADNKPGIKIGDQTLLYSFGDGQAKQRANIYYSESLGIILAYQGTNGSSLHSDFRNFEFLLTTPNPALGLSPGVMVDTGFQQAWYGTWEDVKNALHEAKNTYPNVSIVVTGHSQGATQASLGAMAINKEFGNSSVDKVIVYGPPRVGNPAYADEVDRVYGGKYVGVVNGADWVPSVPTTGMGYQHPSSMVWINPANTTSWATYPGQENINGPLGHIPQYFVSGTLTLDFDDHQGIYVHSSLGAKQGPCPAQVGGY